MAHRFSRAQRLFAVVVAAVLLVGLAGCRSNPDPAPLPPAPSSSPAKPTPSTAAPTMPAEANGTGAKAAKAFVRYWVEELNYAGSSGHVDELAATSAPSCVSCNGVIRSIRKVHRHGGHYEGDGWSVETIKYQPLQPRDRPVLTVGMNIAPQILVAHKGAPPKKFDGGRRSMTFRLERAGERWLVLEVDQPA